jgi:hypothetical protein
MLLNVAGNSPRSTIDEPKHPVASMGGDMAGSAQPAYGPEVAYIQGVPSSSAQVRGSIIRHVDQ